MKKFFIFSIFIILIFSLTGNIKILASNDIKNIYDEQAKISKADTLIDSLPNETYEYLKDIDANSINWNDLINIKCENVLKKIFEISKSKIPNVFKSISFTVAIILLSALFNTFENSFNKGSLGGVISVISNLCIGISLVKPICRTIENADIIIHSISKLLVCYIPIMGGIMVASGQNISAFSYSSTMIMLGNLSVQVSNYLLVPFLNCFLALSLATSLSSKLNLTSLTSWLLKTIKWILSLIASIFVGVLTIKNVIGNASDSVNSKTMKFLLSGCVPVIGSALGDAFSTVQGCVKLLKSGVGAFFILAVIFIFLPIILECSIWIISINLCTSFGEIFALTKISKILNCIVDVLKIILAVLFCLLVVLIVSTVILLSCGGA